MKALSPGDSTRAILVVQLRQLGDILLTTPCLEALRSTFPGSRLCFLTHKMGLLVAKGNPYVDEIFTYSDDMPLSEWWTLLRRLRRERFDLAIDFMNNPRSAMMVAASGTKHSVAFNSSRSWLYSRSVPKGPGGEYIVREKFRLLEPLGIRYQQQALHLPVSSDDIDFCVQSLPPLEDRQRRVVLSPTHRRPRRRWQPEKFAAISDYLSDSWGAQVVWIWGPGEMDQIEAAKTATRHPSIIAPQTTFRQMAALIGQSHLFVGTSNGPSHVAVAVQTPSLQLHGHTDARSWCPQTPQHRSIQSDAFRQADATLDPISPAAVISTLDEMESVVMARHIDRH